MSVQISKINFKLLAILLAAFVCSVSAATVDNTFSPVLQDFGSSANGFPTVYTSFFQPDGKILIGGKFTVANGVARSKIARFNPDYTLDTTFDPKDLATDENSSFGSINIIKMQADGKILIGGSFKFENPDATVAIARLNADGSRDLSFQSVIFAGIGDIEIQPDGKLIVGGSFEITATNPQNGQTVTFKNLARLNTDGSFDFSFTGNALRYSDNIVLQPDGKIVVGNSQYSPPGPQGILVNRYNTNGTLDATLATIDGFGIKALEIQPDGKFVLAGDINYVNNVFRKRIARLNQDGSLDSTFEVVDTLNGTIYDIYLEPDGKVNIVGDFYIYDGTVTQYNMARLNSDGTRDTSFNIDRRISGNVYEVNKFADGRLLIGGAFPVTTDIVNFNTFYDNIARVNPNGTIETGGISFSATEQGGVFDTLQQTDGKILVGGEFQFAEGVSRRFLARYNIDGSFDAGFDTFRNIGIVSNIAQQPDGKILAVNSAGTSVLLTRLDTDGSVDTSFNSPFVPFSASIQQRTIVRVVVVQPDGKILVAGKLITGSATSPTLSGMVRLLPNGSLDPAFNIVFARGGTNFINDIALQPGGKIVIGGDFTDISNNTAYRYLARVNADGTVDTSFNPPSPPSPIAVIQEIELQPDGKIVYAGNFNVVLRVNADGTPDSFNVPVNSDVQALTVQPSGKILIGGHFTVIGGTERRRVARLNNNGSVDTGFNVRADNAVYDISLQTDGKILLGGQFTRINYLSRIAAARLLDSNSAGRTPFDFDGDGKADISIFRPSNGNWWISRSSGGVFAAEFGNGNDKIVPADFTGDGKTDIAFFRPSTGEWFIIRSEDNSFHAYPFGLAEDIPTPADFDGDGKADTAVFRPSTATWYILRSSDLGVTYAQFGVAEDKPVAADYDGDGKADIAIFRPSVSEWWVLRSTGGIQAVQFGQAGDKTVQGDYTGDGKADIAIWRPATGFWYILRSEDTSLYGFPFGTGGDIPVPADYDGDGKTDASVFRPSDTIWYLLQSQAGFSAVQFGTSGDVPTPAAFRQ